MKRLLIVLLFAVPAQAQPFVFAPGSPVSQPRIGFAPASFGTMRIASDGTNLLLVWNDDRASLPAHAFGAGHRYGTFMTRVDAQGNVLDVPNIALPDFGEAWPFWDGSQYVVAGSAGKYFRMSAAGELLDAAPRPIDLMPRGGIVDMVWSGERVLVVSRTYTSNTPATELYAAMYDHGFNVVRGEFLIESTPNGYLGDVRVATSGHDFLIVRNKLQNGYAMLAMTALDREGSIVREAPPSTSNARTNIWIAWDGDRYLLLYDMRPDPVDQQWEYRGAFLDGIGVFLGSTGPFGIGNVLPPYQHASLTWEGDSYQFVYPRGTYQLPPFSDDQFVVYGVTIDAAGNSYNRLGDKLESLLHKPIPYGFATWGRPGKRVVMILGSDSYETGDPVRWKGRIYDSPSQYAAAPQFTVGQGVLPEESPAAATAGDVSLLAWREADQGNVPFALLAARFDAHGRTLDAVPLRLASSTCDGTTPRVATNGRDFLVAWQDRGGVKAMRIGGDGRMLDAAPLTIFTDDKQPCSASSRPAIGWNGSDYLVARAAAGVSAVRVAPDGTLRDTTPIRIAAEDGVANANVASDGHDFFVGWETPQNVAVGARVTGGVSGTAISLAVAHPSLILWDGTSYAILSAEADGLRAVRVDRDGQLVDRQPAVLAAPVDARDPQGGCDARGCSVFAMTDGVVVATRIEETPSGLAATSTPLAHTNGTWQQMIVFGPGLTQFGRLEPYLGSYHLFTSQLLPARGRATR